MLSIESQTRELNDIAQKLNLNIVEKPLSESRSAKVTGRPVFNYLLEKINSGECNSLLVWHPDRISRNPEDSAQIISLMDSEKLLEVATPSQRFINNPMDKFMLGFFMMQAKFENDNKGENVKRGLKTKAEKGWLPSGAKPGYKNDKYAEKGNKKIKKDPKTFSLVRNAMRLILDGIYSPPGALDELNNEWGYRTPKHKKLGGKPLARSMWYQVLSDPFYYGEFEYPIGSGNWHQGKHEPMITKGEHDKLQILLGRKGCRRPKTHDFTYTGLLKCGECKAAITAEEKWQIICSNCKFKFASQSKSECAGCQTKIQNMVNPKVLHYIYYHCTKRKNPNCTQGSINADALEQQVGEILSNIQISERFKNWAIKHLNELTDKEVDDRNNILKSQQDSYKDVIKRLDNLNKLFISPQNSDESVISLQEFKTTKEPLLKEKTKFEELMKDTGNRVNKWLELSEKTFNFACYARHWFTNGDPQTKRQIFQGLGSNLILINKTVRVDIEKPLQFIELAKKEAPEITPMFEPSKRGFTEAQTQDFYSQNPALLRR